eukprot:TRINITY_DN21136_c0_g1_i1.p1 TRINITY_DN21136_c0_g1~~TRINITY_DN21136_c0_g1_i1.p1  ORF type:complete len:351 (-),score=74.80 TRINITY_DN21136_c0_g1_i1:342-1394(-)
MRVQCDVCEKALAAVMCCADEAALCTQCDLRVHAANKLASKHQRVSLLAPTGDPPTCDICQEKSAFFFCLEDRALLCRDCDVSIHLPNSLSASHRRFLLTGTRVALEAMQAEQPGTESGVTELQAVPGTVPTSSSLGGDFPGTSRRETKPFGGQQQQQQQPYLSSMFRSVNGSAQAGSSSYSQPSSFPQPSFRTGDGGEASASGSGAEFATRRNASSDYLSDAVPGWRVDELLNLPELAEGYSLADIGSSKAEMEAASLGDFEWTADLSLFDEQLYAENFHEVPSLPDPFGFPPTSSSRSHLSGAFKGRGRYNASLEEGAAVVPDYDEAFVVPDMGRAAEPATKRRRNYS